MYYCQLQKVSLCEIAKFYKERLDQHHKMCKYYVNWFKLLQKCASVLFKHPNLSESLSNGRLTSLCLT